MFAVPICIMGTIAKGGGYVLINSCRFYKKKKIGDFQFDSLDNKSL